MRRIFGFVIVGVVLLTIGFLMAGAFTRNLEKEYEIFKEVIELMEKLPPWLMLSGAVASTGAVYFKLHKLGTKTLRWIASFREPGVPAAHPHPPQQPSGPFIHPYNHEQERRAS